MDLGIAFGPSIAVLIAGEADLLGTQAGTLVPAAFIGAALAAVAYWPAFEASPLQGTPGKRALDAKVVSRRGERLGVVAAIVRHLGRLLMLVLLPPLGYLIAVGTPGKRALDDYLSGSLVVRRRAEPAEVRAAPRTMTVGRWLAVAAAVTVAVTPYAALSESRPGVDLRRALGIYPADEPPMPGGGESV